MSLLTTASQKIKLSLSLLSILGLSSYAGQAYAETIENVSCNCTAPEGGHVCSCDAQNFKIADDAMIRVNFACTNETFNVVPADMQSITTSRSMVCAPIPDSTSWTCANKDKSTSNYQISVICADH